MWPTSASFIQKWKNASGGERAQGHSFVIDLCHLLGVADPHDGDYKFEYPLKAAHATDFADLYKRGCFIWEAKQSRAKGQKRSAPGHAEVELFPNVECWHAPGRSWESLMENALQQAVRYASHLPDEHGWPPFILICDIGQCIDVFADFSGLGLRYEQFPDAQNFRVRIDDFADPLVRERFRAIWEDPHSLNPMARCERALRQIAGAIAMVSERLEARHPEMEEETPVVLRQLFTGFREQSDFRDHNRILELLAQG